MTKKDKIRQLKKQDRFKSIPIIVRRLILFKLRREKEDEIEDLISGIKEMYQDRELANKFRRLGVKIRSK